MTCVFFQFEWIKGITWKQFIESKPIEDPTKKYKKSCYLQ